MTEPPGLALEGVCAGYGDTVIVEGVALDLPPGGTLAVLGRNGVGKTTLLATIMGHTRLHGGRIRFRGREISNLLVPNGTPGYEQGEPYRKMGWNASDTRPLSFT